MIIFFVFISLRQTFTYFYYTLSFLQTHLLYLPPPPSRPVSPRPIPQVLSVQLRLLLLAWEAQVGWLRVAMPAYAGLHRVLCEPRCVPAMQEEFSVGLLRQSKVRCVRPGGRVGRAGVPRDVLGAGVGPAVPVRVGLEELGE